MIRLIIFSFALTWGSLSLAGGNSDYTKIRNVTYKASGQIVIEFDELVQEKHFMSIFPKGIRKLRFDYLNWPSGSRHSTWWYKILPWTESKNDFVPKDFETCINQMIQNYKNQTSFQFGQMGGGKFQVVEEAQDEVIIPNLLLRQSDDGKEQICYIDLG